MGEHEEMEISFPKHEVYVFLNRFPQIGSCLSHHAVKVNLPLFSAL